MKKQISTDKIRENHPTLLYADLTYEIRGAIFEVYNQLGYGHKEQFYQKALLKEFEERNIPFKREVPLKVTYKGEKVGNYRPDFVIDGKIIVELKAVSLMPNASETQLIQYLKATGFELGILVNFGTPKLYIKRFVNTYPRKSQVFLPEINPRESLVPPSGTERG